jgi:hypothetical protein
MTKVSTEDRVNSIAELLCGAYHRPGPRPCFHCRNVAKLIIADMEEGK